MSKSIYIVYRNWKNDLTLRKITPYENSFFWGSTEYHPEEQWLLKAYDEDKKADRIFAVKDMMIIQEHHIKDWEEIINED